MGITLPCMRGDTWLLYPSNRKKGRVRHSHRPDGLRGFRIFCSFLGGKGGEARRLDREQGLRSVRRALRPPYSGGSGLKRKKRIVCVV